MTRDELKTQARGKYHEINIEIKDREKVNAYVEGALFAYDYLMKPKTPAKEETKLKEGTSSPGEVRN